MTRNSCLGVLTTLYFKSFTSGLFFLAGGQVEDRGRRSWQGPVDVAAQVRVERRREVCPVRQQAGEIDPY